MKNGMRKRMKMIKWKVQNNKLRVYANHSSQGSSTRSISPWLCLDIAQWCQQTKRKTLLSLSPPPQPAATLSPRPTAPPSPSPSHTAAPSLSPKSMQTPYGKRRGRGEESGDVWGGDRYSSPPLGGREMSRGRGGGIRSDGHTRDEVRWSHQSDCEREREREEEMSG